MQQAAKGVESAPSQCTAGKQSRLSGNNQALNGGELGSSPEDSGNLPNQYSSPCRWIVRSALPWPPQPRSAPCRLHDEGFYSCIHVEVGEDGIVFREYCRHTGTLYLPCCPDCIPENHAVDRVLPHDRREGSMWQAGAESPGCAVHA